MKRSALIITCLLFVLCGSPLSPPFLSAATINDAGDAAKEAQRFFFEGTRMQLQGDLEGALKKYRDSNALQPNQRLEKLIVQLEKQIGKGDQIVPGHAVLPDRQPRAWHPEPTMAASGTSTEKVPLAAAEQIAGPPSVQEIQGENRQGAGDRAGKRGNPPQLGQDAKASQATAQEVLAEGTGPSEREAVTDAFRNAIENTVGLYVDSETKMRNDQLISDNILTSSKAYIERYRLVSKKEEGGLAKVQIKALVKMEDVRAKLTVLNIATMALEDSANIHARLSTKFKRGQDAEQVLAKELGKIFQTKNLLNLLEVKLDNYTIDENNIDRNKTVPYEVNFTVSVNKRNYEIIANNLSETLIGIGGVIIDRIKINKETGLKNKIKIYNSYITRDRSHKYSSNEFHNVFFGIVRYNENEYILDKYSFPGEWKTIYPWFIGRESEFLTPCKYCGDTLRFDDLEISIQFVKNGTVIFEEVPKKISIDSIFIDHRLKFLKFLWGFTSVSDIGFMRSGWSDIHELQRRAGGFGIGPFFENLLEMYSSLTLQYKGRINIDLLYDIQNIEIKLREKAR